jgi:5-methylcytosine-specific restriction protein B
MPDDTRLNLEKTYQVIREAALDRRFVSYGEIAEASGVPWNAAWRRMPQHLGQLVLLTHQRGWPMPSSIVVPKDEVATGKLDGTAREGLIAAAKDVGLEVGDPEEFVKDQQRKVFEWAKTAPEHLGAEPGDVDSKAHSSTGPRFVQYFGPVLDALRAMGGEAKPKDVFDWIIKNEIVPKSDIGAVTKGGNPSFENRVGWARFYLVKAGFIDDSRRGIWALTEEGQGTKLDDAAALEMFKGVRTRGWGDEDEDAPAPVAAGSVTELFNDPARQFWFVGAAWQEGDQTERFLKEGIWQNGYENKFADLVKTMRPGDRIAIKSSFVKKRNLPFDAGRKMVSCMRIKATGTVTENAGDGKNVKVDWTPVEPPRDWFLYTYRTTLHKADPDEDYPRRLILFTFAAIPQDYQFWVQQPYFARKFSASAAPATLEPLFDGQDEGEADTTAEMVEILPYQVSDIEEEGCFLPKEAIEGALQRLKEKKNVILQGPPGTGKTWLAKRLAYALVGTKDRKVIRPRVHLVQFHPSLSYEDFVRGWRPTGGGKLELVDGVFLKLVQAASAVPEPFVLIIEEINRGNPAQVFGEMLTLLEDTKRRQDEALQLAYSREEGERIHIPPNLYIVGTMNIADRSLALVDLAFRRRFAFISLEPRLGPLWRAWCAEKAGLNAATINLIEQRIEALNSEIAGDRSLGPQFRIGHSYVTPKEGAAIADGSVWFSHVVNTEIAPLLEEYWFDAPDKAAEARRRLLADLT